MTLCIIVVTAVSGTINSLRGTGFEVGGYRAAANIGIGAAANPNRLAFFCVLGIALSWSCKEIVRSRVLGAVLTAAIPGLALAALLTASRSGLLNLLVVFSLFAMEGKFSVKRQLHLIGFAAVVIFLASDLLSGTHADRLKNIVPGSSIEVAGTSSTESTEDRLKTLSDVSRIIAENPILGTGIGNVRWVRLQIFGSARPPHNSYLLAIAEGGVPALILYLVLYGFTLKHLMDTEKKSRLSEIRFIARSLRIGLIAFLFFTFFADFWSSIMTYFFVGLAIVLKRLQVDESFGNLVLRPSYRPIPTTI
jgi:O-antigen ligase